MNLLNNHLSGRSHHQAIGSELGKTTEYDQTYNPARLYPIARSSKRKEIGIDPDALPFIGFDCWNHYEVSWLNEQGKPIVAIAEIFYDCNSPFIIESKSLKLYFNSLNNYKFTSIADLTATVKKALTKASESPVSVLIKQLGTAQAAPVRENFAGECIDDLDIACATYTVAPAFLSTTEKPVAETLYSNLLKSNCPVTKQPDWGSVQITYKGNEINRAGLLRYIVSFRNHHEFHEQCIERIFVDIMQYCKPKELTIYGRYTRRGGIDINPYRSTHNGDFAEMNSRLLRQ